MLSQPGREAGGGGSEEGDQHDARHIFRCGGRGDGKDRQPPVQPRSFAHSRQHTDQERGRNHDDHHPKHQHSGRAKTFCDDLRNRLLEHRRETPVALQHAAAQGGRSRILPAPDAAARGHAILGPGPAGDHAQPFAVTGHRRPAIAVAFDPAFHVGIAHPGGRLGFGKFFKVGGKIGQIEDNKGQAQRRQNHRQNAPDQESKHWGASPAWALPSAGETRRPKGARTARTACAARAGSLRITGQAAIHHL